MKTSFTSKQREILARKMGYDGPMQGFDEFLNSSPALMMKYNAVTDKYAQRMAKGGSVTGYADGGLVQNPDGTYTDQATGMKYAANAVEMSGTDDWNPVSVPMLKKGAQPIPTPAAAPPASTPASTTAPTPTAAPIPSVQQGQTTEAKQSTGTPVESPATAPAVTPPPAGFFEDTGPPAPSPAPPAPEPSPPPPPPSVTGGGNVTFSEEQGRTGTPSPGAAAGFTPATTPITSGQDISGVGGAGTAKTVTDIKTATAEEAKMPDAITATTMEASKSAEGVKGVLEGTKPLSFEEWSKDKAFPAVIEIGPDGEPINPATAAYEEYVSTFKPEGGVQAVKGTVSKEAQVDAAQKEPTETVLSDLEAEQLDKAREVQAPPELTVGAGELLDKSAVNMAKVDEAISKTKEEAAQGVVSDDMTVQGQLTKLTANFDAKNPPGWAAAALRVASTTLAQRGLSASSLAGAAIVQAAIESALPIATADAKAYQATAEQNLSNRQAMAVLAAQQRAAFLEQEFNQEFEVKVKNAARIADVANLNFTAKQQIALENARLAQSVDLANLENRQAVVIAKAAQMATLETTNLTNLQQAAVTNAQSFLAMDLANYDREQKTTLFKTEQLVQSLLSDTAAENAAKQFNAASKTQVDQFMATLASTISQFNVAQRNALTQFSTDQLNSVTKFNTEQENLRDQFNSTQRLVIDQSNAQWRREVSTADTAALNAALYLGAQNLQQMTLAEYNNETQLFRDQLEKMWQSFEKNEDRRAELLIAEIRGAAAEEAAEAGLWEKVVDGFVKALP